MTVYATENIRNIAVVGHSDTGKTSLVSALLFDSGAVNRLCKVDDANTTTDFDDDEHDRKITINTAVAYIEHRGVKVNLRSRLKRCGKLLPTSIYRFCLPST
jgi:elongation factor G